MSVVSSHVSFLTSYVRFSSHGYIRNIIKKTIDYCKNYVKIFCGDSESKNGLENIGIM